MANFTAEDIDNMSDEQLMALDTSSLSFNSEEPIDVDPPADADEPANQDENNVPEDEVVEDEDNKGTTEAVDDNTPADEVGDPAKADEKAPADTGEEKPTDADKASEVKVVDDEASIKAFHAKITAPFKANGREMQVESADEAIQLMQMGANYNKKMKALRPNLQLMKMLENAGLLDEEKLNFLIDVASKKPEAISKLVQDSGIDPLDISAEKAGEYRATSYKPSDKSLALDEVLDDLKGSEHYARTLGVVAESLDDASKQFIADNPNVLRNLHQHIADGVFDQVWKEVERQKTVGSPSLSGLTDLEAYRQVGDAMQSSGKLQLPAGVAPPPSQVQAPAKVIAPSKPKQADDSNRRTQRQAAGPTKAAVPTSTSLPADFNPLNMSDEEIMKLDYSKFA